MSTASAKVEVTINRETGSGGHPLLAFTGPFRPFKLGYTKLKMIVERQTDVCQFLADVEREQSAKEAEERARAEAAEKAKKDPTTQAIIKSLEVNLVGLIGSMSSL